MIEELLREVEDLQISHVIRRVTRLSLPVHQVNRIEVDLSKHYGANKLQGRRGKHLWRISRSSSVTLQTHASMYGIGFVMLTTKAFTKH